MIDRQPGGTAEERLSRSSGRRARGNRAGLPGRRGRGARRRVRACLASSVRYFRDCRAVLLEVDEADEGATGIREDDGRDRAYALLDSFRVVLDDAAASPRLLAIRALERCRRIGRRPQGKRAVLEHERIPELFFEAPEADRRRVAPGSEIVGIDDRADR